MSASTLWKFAKALDVDVPYFFEGLPEAEKSIEAAIANLGDPTGSASATKFTRDAMRIPDRAIRKEISRLVKTLVE